MLSGHRLGPSRSASHGAPNRLLKAAGTCSAPGQLPLDYFTPAGHPQLRGNGKDATFGWPTNGKIEALREEWFNAQDHMTQRRIGVEGYSDGSVQQCASYTTRASASANGDPP